MDENWEAMIRILKQQGGTLEIEYCNEYKAISVILREKGTTTVDLVPISEIHQLSETIGIMAKNTLR